MKSSFIKLAELTVALAVFAVTLTIMFHRQIAESMIYFPDKDAPRVSAWQGFVAWPEYPGKNFKGYLHVPENPERLIIAFHGNAGNAYDRISYIGKNLADGKSIVYLAEYPGYSWREGKAGGESIVTAALEDAKELKKNYPNLPLILVGESLGTGVAARVASEIPAEKILLVAPFPSLVDAAQFHYPGVPAFLLKENKFDSVANLENVRAKLLILHGDKDSTVPFELGKKLYGAYKGPKEFVALAGFGHNDLPWNIETGEMRAAIQRFLK